MSSGEILNRHKINQAIKAVSTILFPTLTS
jgi:hypothetical protein